MKHELPRPGFIARFFLRWSSRRSLKELVSFVDALKTLQDHEMSELLLLVGMVRIGMEASGITPLEPMNVVIYQRPNAAVEMARQSVAFKARGQVAQALAFTAWGHTFRAAVDGSLQPMCRQMWEELARGRSGLRAAAYAAKTSSNIDVDPDEAAKIPRWFA